MKSAAIIIILIAVAVKGHHPRRITFPSILEHLNRYSGVDTRDLIADKCANFEVLSYEQDTVTPHYKIRLLCTGLDPAALHMKICDWKCHNPLTCNRMVRMSNRPVLMVHPVYDRDDVKHHIRLPVACECKPIVSKSRICSKRKFKNIHQ